MLGRRQTFGLGQKSNLSPCSRQPVVPTCMRAHSVIHSRSGRQPVPVVLQTGWPHGTSQGIDFPLAMQSVAHVRGSVATRATGASGSARSSSPQDSQGNAQPVAPEDSPAELILLLIGFVFRRILQAVVLATYLAFWFWLLYTLYLSSNYSPLVGVIPVLLLFLSDWGVLKLLATIWITHSLHAWPLLLGKLAIDFVHKLNEHRLESYNKTTRVLAALMGRDLRTPVMSNFSVLHFTQADAQVFPPITGVLSDQSDVTTTKWESLWDIVWGVAIVWFIFAHFMMYEQFWGTYWPFEGFNFKHLGTWHMPEFPEFWRAGPGVPIVRYATDHVWPWGPYR